MPNSKIIPFTTRPQPHPDPFEVYFDNKIQSLRETLSTIPRNTDIVGERLTTIEKQMARLLDILESKTGGGL